jgi:hypothetical protein
LKVNGFQWNTAHKKTALGWFFVILGMREMRSATIKLKYHREKDVVLSPCSTNAVRKEVRFYEGDELKVQGVMVAVLEDT